MKIETCCNLSGLYVKVFVCCNICVLVGTVCYKLFSCSASDKITKDVSFLFIITLKDTKTF